MNTRVQLIAYVDRLSGGGLKELQELLRSQFHGLFGGIHLLPCYHFFDLWTAVTPDSTLWITPRSIRD
jgi:sucrose phosphorylase